MVLQRMPVTIAGWVALMTLCSRLGGAGAGCTDAGTFAGALLPCTGASCSTTTMTCARLASVGGCVAHFGEVFDFSASPPTTTSRSLAIGADLPVAMGCCATCGVDRMGAAEVDELISMFKKFDRNGDGSIDGSELKALLHVSGADASDAQVATMLADNDADGDGVISFSEFVGIVRAGEASEAAHAGAAGGGRGAAGGCVESSVTVGGNTLSCSHYVQLGYTCEVLTTTPQFMSQFDCHCSCPGASSAVPKAPGAKQCNTNALAGACADPSIMTADHLCDNICSAYLLAHWDECSTDREPEVRSIISAFAPVQQYCNKH